MGYDPRSDAAAEYRRWYGLKAWKDRRKDQLTREPLCRFCMAMGRVTEARVADHITPHKGDHDQFWFGELQSLCKQCHDASKQQIEVRGYHALCDERGYPIDPAHPSNSS